MDNDAEDAIHNPTEEELAAGDFLGQVINIFDDEDDGSQWGDCHQNLFDLVGRHES